MNKFNGSFFMTSVFILCVLVSGCSVTRTIGRTSPINPKTNKYLVEFSIYKRPDIEQATMVKGNGVLIGQFDPKVTNYWTSFTVYLEDRNYTIQFCDEKKVYHETTISPKYDQYIEYYGDKITAFRFRSGLFIWQIGCVLIGCD